MKNKYENWALQALRFFLGTVFIIYGWKKVTDPAMFVAVIEQIGLPGVSAYFIAYAQFISGVLLFFDVATQYILPIFIFIMLGAIITVGINGGFFVSNGGFEYQLGLLLISTYLFTKNIYVRKNK
jgi:uncharacterized membrane protein YphA (DoxX/SURF4 family)